MLWVAAARDRRGIAQRRRIEGWFRARRAAWAGLAGAAAATVAGTLANDSGGLMLIIGTALCALSRRPRLGHAGSPAPRQVIADRHDSVR